MHSAGVHRTGAERFHNRRFEARHAVRLVLVVNADMHMLAANSLASGTVYTARTKRAVLCPMMVGKRTPDNLEDSEIPGDTHERFCTLTIVHAPNTGVQYNVFKS